MAIKGGTEIVKLNVGGKKESFFIQTTFATSSTTLLSAGESFFTSLLSGRHEIERDETGAIFIDRSPRYFEPILHYLRTNNLVIHGIKLSSLRSEAEFYGIQKIVDHLDHLEKENAAKNEPQKVMPLLKEVGCYVNADNDHAFMFEASDKLMCISGYEAFTQALVIQSYPNPELPSEWKSDQSQARSFAQFFASHAKRGFYKMNKDGKGMILTLPGKHGSVHQHLAILSNDMTKLCVTSFSCSAGSALFECTHDNPHHFHLYNLHKF